MLIIRRLSLGLSALVIVGIGALAALWALGIIESTDSDAAPPGSRKKRLPAEPALAKFHARLKALESGDLALGHQLVVLQIGDSHTASDHISGRLRSLLQRRFGDAGRGLLPPGVPHAFYRPYGVTVTQSSGWQLLASTKTASDSGPFGLSGLIQRGLRPEDVIAIEPRGTGIEPPAALARIEITVRRQPAGGTVIVHTDGEALASIATAGESGRFETFAVPLKPGARRIELRPHGDGPVDIADFTLIAERRGITVANLGFIGATVSLPGRWEWPVVSAQIAHLDPALIILAFGTNEGFSGTDRIIGGYENQFEQRLLALQRAAPNAALVVVGPPDAARYPRYCLPPPPPLSVRNGLNGTLAEPPTGPGLGMRALRTGTITAAWPLSEPPETAVCTPLAVDERSRYDQLLAAKDQRLCRWHTPAAIPLVREIQRRVAARLGALFFDWSALFEGECGVDRWVRQGLAHKDRVHLKQEGYARAADRLHELIMAGYPATRIAPGSKGAR